MVDNGPSPPSGWELPPTIEKKESKGKKSAAAACCGFDQLCCSRQTDIDHGKPSPALRVFDVPFGKVPEATIKEASKGGPAIEGVPPVRVVDGTGAPFPWLEGPKQFEIRIIPPGELGYIRFGRDNSAAQYENPRLRTLGYGVTAPIGETPDKGRSLVAGPLEYWTFNRGEGDTVIHDHVKGKLEGSPNIVTERWEHVAALDAADGIVYVYRAVEENKPSVFFVLPEAILGFESKEAQSFGGTSNDRFASDFPYTRYNFPLGPGRSNTINCITRDYEINRWFARPKGATKLPDTLLMSISMSQTSVETEPHIRIVFF